MNHEPTIAVGIVENIASVTLHLLSEYTDATGYLFIPDRYVFTLQNGMLSCPSLQHQTATSVSLTGVESDAHFRVEVTIGIDFHWEQKMVHTFCGGIRLCAQADGTISVINDVPLETYIESVSSSEMSATSPEEFLKAHSIISRSWLLAQIAAKSTPVPVPESNADTGEIIRWYDRQSHTKFDVCADDHCQRYQGTDMITTGVVSQAVAATRGKVLMFNGAPCDARFSKCCGGVVEDFRLAWGDTFHPYLVPLADSADTTLPTTALSNETAARAFIESAPEAYCNCKDPAILGSVLNSYDQSTSDFYRWQVTLSHEEIAALLKKKLSLDLGRILALEPVKRGLSGRLEKLRIIGDRRTVIIGKELEIRRALSPAHLYSSAFVVDKVGSPDKPDAFTLKGAGWGHGVGLCQIGAAVMAWKGIGHEEILEHYYPGSVLTRVYD